MSYYVNYFLTSLLLHAVLEDLKNRRNHEAIFSPRFDHFVSGSITLPGKSRF